MLEPTSEFIEARAAWEHLRSDHKQAKDSLEAARAAATMRRKPATPIVTVGGFGGRPVTTTRMTSKVEAVAQAFEEANPDLSDLRLGRLLEDLEDAEQAARARMQAGAPAWERARGIEQNRIAAAHKAPHQAALARVAAAVHGLSTALQTERQIREAAQRMAGCDLSAALPPADTEFRGTLVEHTSVLSLWAARMRQAGFL